MKTVVVLGASSNPERYSNKAIKMLLEHGFKVIPINPYEKSILELDVVKSIEDVTEPIHAITIYLNPKRLLEIKDSLVNAKPTYAIFNPGAESPETMQAMSEVGTKCENACTLVLLTTGQFPGQ